MPNSLTSMIKKLTYKGKISYEEEAVLLNKIVGHDRTIYNKAVDDFCSMIAGWNSISSKKVPYEAIREISKQLKGSAK